VKPNQARLSIVPDRDYWHCSAGSDSQEWHAGDFLLVHDNSRPAKFIRFGERRSYHGHDPLRDVDLKTYAYWNHAVGVTTDEGDTVQAGPRGVVHDLPHTYQPLDYVYVHLHLDTDYKGFTGVGKPNDQLLQASTAQYWNYNVGQPYDFFEIVGIAINQLTGGKLTLGIDGTDICSGLVAQGLERERCIFPIDAAQLMPADLAYIFDVRGPQSV
jgi:hypothetical protein